MAKAALIEANVEEIDALLALLRSGLEQRMDWGELQDLIDESGQERRCPREHGTQARPAASPRKPRAGRGGGGRG